MVNELTSPSLDTPVITSSADVVVWLLSSLLSVVVVVVLVVDEGFVLPPSHVSSVEQAAIRNSSVEIIQN
jgi:hypothetical protein